MKDVFGTSSSDLSAASISGGVYIRPSAVVPDFRKSNSGVDKVSMEVI